jgi:hypothetical protein
VFETQRIELWLYWIREREAVRKARFVAGKPPPWSNDHIMNEVRFTNVRRMDDRVSQWLLNWYAHPLPVADAVVAATFARLVNRPETLAMYSPQWNGWDPDRARAALTARAAHGPVFTGAYIINSAVKGSSKIQTVIDTVQAVHQQRDALTAYNTVTMQGMHTALQAVRGIGSFIGGQIVADMRYICGNPDTEWLDRHKWAPRGPGSARGMAWLMRRDEPVHSELLFSEGLGKLMRTAHRRIPAIHADRQLEAIDYQNTLCELSKYVRVMTGGRAKNRFRPIAV